MPKNDRDRVFSREEIAKHNSINDCWIISDGHVYDCTTIVKIHPGGVNSILRKAGGIHDCSEDMALHSKNARQNYWEPCRIGRVEGTKGGVTAGQFDSLCIIM